MPGEMGGRFLEFNQTTRGVVIFKYLEVLSPNISHFSIKTAKASRAVDRSRRSKNVVALQRRKVSIFDHDTTGERTVFRNT